MNENVNVDTYPVPLTFNWRLIHSTLYFIGGISFVFASWQYYASIANYLVGGWLFTIGSAGFAAADCLEWWTNNRIGCFLSLHYLESFEYIYGKDCEPNNTFVGILQRSSNGVNFFLSFIGSSLYLIGSIFFIPVVNQNLAGIYVFIIASIVIVIAQAWKIIKGGVTSWKKLEFSFLNYDDVPAVFVDGFAGLGAFFYLLGSIFFLPNIDTTAFETREGTNFFVVGGVLYALSSLSMIYRYFFTQKFDESLKKLLNEGSDKL
jgi:hypothetical protein